jgi:hypothetical protein
MGARQRESQPVAPQRVGQPPGEAGKLPSPQGRKVNNQTPEHRIFCIADILSIGEVSNIGTPCLDGINTHTSGTEFYGCSSNLAFLARLCAKAHNRAITSSNHVDSTGLVNGPYSEKDVTSELRHLNDKESSIVDLMYSTDYQSTTDQVAPSNQDAEETLSLYATVAPPSLDTATSKPSQKHREASAVDSPSHVPPLRFRSSKLPTQEEMECREATRVEKLFIDAYFINVHYIHPILLENSFKAQCVRNVWSHQSRSLQDCYRSQFMALYYAVVALGAINSGIDQGSSLAKYYTSVSWEGSLAASTNRSTLEWASLYFALAKQALGDIMEISSLETCQALFLMVTFHP